MAHDVFICYSHKDQPIADGICAQLEADGVRCWIAPRDIGPGEDWPTAIATGIAGSKAMVLVFSQNSNVSEEVSRELYLAANSKVLIIPFVIENVKPEAGKAYYLGRTHWLDAMNPPTAEQIGQLSGRVQSLLESAASPGGARGVLSVARVLEFRQRVQRKGRWAIPAALLMVAVLAIGGLFFLPRISSALSPVGLSQGSPVDASFYLYREDFDDPEFDGELPPEIGPGENPCPEITIVQEHGALTFRTSADALPSCSVGPGSWYSLAQVRALEFAVSTSPELPVESASFGFFMNGASEPGQSGGLGLNCALNGSQSGCMVGNGQGWLYQTTRFTVTPGQTYIFRIEILDPDLMSFGFTANNETIGQFTVSPEDVPLYKDLTFHVAGGVMQMGGRPRAGEYYLDYLAVEQR